MQTFADDLRLCPPVAVNGDEDVAAPWTGAPVMMIVAGASQTA
ncbi:MAG: hypothetical protein ACAI34_16945 [Verrucomicrobium sp.]